MTNKGFEAKSSPARTCLCGLLALLSSLIPVLLFILLFFGLTPFHCFAADSFSMDGGLFVSVRDVGQGLAVYCECDGHAMLYDGGGRDTSAELVAFLRERGISHLDLAVVSHYDDDHVAGVIGALHVFGCDLILAPDYIGNTTIYTSFRQLVEEKGIPCEAPAVGNVYPLGTARIETLGPEGFSAEEENDRCPALRVCYGDTALILCGDAQAAEEEAIARGWMTPRADVYVVNHHGSASSSTSAFLDRVDPAYAVISCGEGNDYGHPAASVLERLGGRGIRIWRTDKQGDISFVMDGEVVRFSCESTTDLSPGVPIVGTDGEKTGTDTGEDLKVRYICNFKTFIFHRPDCEMVSKMSEKNKIYSPESRETLLSLGYKACGICRP